MDSSAFSGWSGISTVFTIGALVTVPLGVWKLIEIIVWFCGWFSAHWS